MLWLRDQLIVLLSGSYLLKLELNMGQFIFKTVAAICSRNYRLTTEVQDSVHGLPYATLTRSPAPPVSTMT